MNDTLQRPQPSAFFRWMVLLFISLAMFGNYYIYDSISPLADVLKAQLGYSDLSKVYATEDLAPGEQILFSCTGVTDGELLRGVRFFGGGHRTHTLFMSLTRREIRFVDTIHREDPARPVYFET